MTILEISYLIIIASAVATFAFLCGMERGEDARFDPSGGCKLDNVDPIGSRDKENKKS